MKILFASAISLALASSNVAFGVQDSALATAVVTADLTIAQSSDLDFGSDPRGAGPEIIPAGTTDDANNASFDITGQANAAYSVTVPVDGTVVMTLNGNPTVQADEQIPVNTFTYYSQGAASGSSAQLKGDGTDLLLVGARRDAIDFSEVVGNYQTSFDITVVYQ